MIGMYVQSPGERTPCPLGFVKPRLGGKLGELAPHAPLPAEWREGERGKTWNPPDATSGCARFELHDKS